MMENTNIVTAEQQTPNTISASNAIFNVQALTQLQSVAGLMAQAAVTVPEPRQSGRLHGHHHAGDAVGYEPLRRGAKDAPG